MPSIRDWRRSISLLLSIHRMYGVSFHTRAWGTIGALPREILPTPSIFVVRLRFWDFDRSCLKWSSAVLFINNDRVRLWQTSFEPYAQTSPSCVCEWPIAGERGNSKKRQLPLWKSTLFTRLLLGQQNLPFNRQIGRIDNTLVSSSPPRAWCIVHEGGICLLLAIQLFHCLAYKWA